MKYLERLRDHERAADGIRTLKVMHPADPKELVRDLETQERDALDVEKVRLEPAGYMSRAALEEAKNASRYGKPGAVNDAAIRDSHDMIVAKLGGKCQG